MFRLSNLQQNEDIKVCMHEHTHASACISFIINDATYTDTHTHRNRATKEKKTIARALVAEILHYIYAVGNKWNKLLVEKT